MISVVIPLYNKQDSIVATLQSVLAQTYTDYEIVIVDDGSTDDSAQIAEAILYDYQKRHTEVNFKVLRQLNAGVSAARNTGILAAKGEYIAFLDGDDLWNKKYLETLYKLICDYPDAIIYGIGCLQITDDFQIDKIFNRNNKRGEIDNIWDYDVHYWTGSSATCKKEELLAIGMFDTRMTHGEDLDVWWRLLLRGKGAFDSTILAYYRQDAENRAMNKVIPLEKHIPFYIDKYVEARAMNCEFRHFFDKEMIYRLYPYLFDKHYRKQAKNLAMQMDYSLQKWSMKFRVSCPYLYRVYEIFKKFIS